MTELKQLAEKYLSEHLPGHNQDLIDNKLYTMTISAMVGFADSLSNPPLKPLSELHKDEEACEKIANELGIRGHSIYDWGGGWTIINGLIEKESCKLGIAGTGEMYLELEGFTQDNYNFFGVITLILSLGYDVQPETKTT